MFFPKGMQLANIYAMPTRRRKILVFDEAGFSRICAAILEGEGYAVETISSVNNVAKKFSTNGFSLIITSYPYGASLLKEVQRRNLALATIVLADEFSADLLSTLDGLRNSCCMMKPLDYGKFKTCVRNMVCGECETIGGYNIV